MQETDRLKRAPAILFAMLDVGLNGLWFAISIWLVSLMFPAEIRPLVQELLTWTWYAMLGFFAGRYLRPW